MTTDRIDSERELIEFIQKLKMSNIEIPENVTLEIDSQHLQDYFNSLWTNTLLFELKSNITRFKYMGENMVFKKNNDDGTRESK